MTFPPPGDGHGHTPPHLLVLDTNTVLALWLFADPALTALRQAIQSRLCLLCCSPPVVAELRHVLTYRQFALPESTQQQIMTQYLSYCSRVDIAAALPPLPQCRDADDQKFLFTAWRGKASHLLSRDKALLRLARHRLIKTHFRIQTPEAYIQVLTGTTKISFT